MQKIVSGVLALMCLASVGFAKDKAVAYKEAANKKIAQVMKSGKTINDKIALLEKRVNILEAKKKLSEKEKVELYELYYALGKKNYITLKNYKQAAGYFAKASTINDNSIVEFYRGNSLFYAKEYAEAADAYRKVVLKGDLPAANNPNLYWLKGCAEYFIRDFGAAENDLKTAISLDNNKWEKAAYYVVVCLQKRGNYDEALTWLDKMIDNKNTTQAALRKEADIYCEMGRLDDCELAINDLETFFPTDDSLYLLKAQLNYARGNYDEVTAYLDKEFKKLNRKNTYDYECYIMRAQIALAEGKYKEAFKFVDMAVREPMPPYSTKLRGDIYLAMGKRRRALEQYNAYLRISTSAPRSKYVTELVAKLQNELEEEAMRPENQ